MNKKYLFLITFLLLVGCSSPDNETEVDNSKDTEATSVEENDTADNNDANDTEKQSESTTEESSNNDDESATKEKKDSEESDKDNSDSSLDDKGAEEKDSVEDIADAENSNSKFIDVLSQDFINLYFSGPDTYIPSELTVGMSRKGNPYDNALMESFYKTIKRELIHDANFASIEQAQLEIFKYIETYYNTKRLHSSLGFLSPKEFETLNNQD